MSRSAALIDGPAAGARAGTTVRFEDAAAFALFGGVAVLYGWKSLSLAATAPYWMDEVLAVWTARLTGIGAIWQALLGGAEFSPPGFHLLLHGMILSGANGPLAMRLPSIVAVFAVAVAVALLVRRRAAWPVALAAAAIVPASGIFAYAVQARPYAAVTALVAWALFVWDGIGDRRSAGWRAYAIAGLLTLAVALHFYAILLVGLLGLAEFLRSLRSHRLRVDVWCALAVASASLLLWWPIVQAAAAYNAGDTAAEHFYARPSLTALVVTYLRMLGPVLVPLLVLAVAALIARVRDGAGTRSADDMASLATLFLGVPVVVLVFALTISHTYNDRYAVGVVLGAALLVATLLRRLGRHADGAALVTLFALAVCLADADGGEIARPGRLSTVALMRATATDLPVATGDGLRFLELAEALPPRQVGNLVFLNAPVTSGDPTNRHQVERWAAMRPDLSVRDARDFICRTPRFLLLRDRSGGWDDVPDWLAPYARIAPLRGDPDAALAQVSVERCPAP